MRQANPELPIQAEKLSDSRLFQIRLTDENLQLQAQNPLMYMLIVQRISGCYGKQ